MHQGLKAQLDRPLRIEIEVPSDEATYKIIPVQDQGMLLFYETALSSGKDSTLWMLVCYDKYLQERWRREVPLEKELVYKDQSADSLGVSLLYLNEGKTRGGEKNVLVARVDLATGRVVRTGIEVPNKLTVKDFMAQGQTAYLGFENADNRTVVYRVSLPSGESRVIYSLEEGQSELEKIGFDTAAGQVVLLVSRLVSRDNYHLEVGRFSPGGDPLQTDRISTAGDHKKINTARYVAAGDGKELIIGTFGVTSNKAVDSKNFFDDESAGFYVATLAGGENTGIRYFNFIEFDNLSGYLKGKDYWNVKKKAGRGEKESSQASLDYELLVHDILHREGKFYFVAEAFSPEYHNVTRMYYDFYGRPMPYTYSVFDGYRYFNALIACFDGDGEKQWDNGIEIYNILTYQLVNRVNIYFSDDEVVMAYNNNGKIAYKALLEGQAPSGMQYQPVESLFPEDKVMEDSKSNMVPWYGSYFICYGYQTIRNNSYSGSDKRTVFYINKVQYQ